MTIKKSKSNKYFIGGWIVGLLFALGMMFIDLPEQILSINTLLHLLTPGGIAGFLGLLLSDYIETRRRSTYGKYLIYGLLGTLAAVIIVCIFIIEAKDDIIIQILYLGAWTGFIAGIALRLALDEVVLSARKDNKIENRTSKRDKTKRS